MSEESDQQRRPTLRLRDEQAAAPQWLEEISSVHTKVALGKVLEAVSGLTEDLGAVSEKQSKKTYASWVAVLISVFTLGGAVATGISQLGIWSAKDGLLVESKVDARDAHDRLHAADTVINQRIDQISAKLDDLPAKVAAEVKRRR